MATKRKTPRATRRKDRDRGLTNNALVAAVVGGIISLVVSLVVTHFQNQSAASQARSAQLAAAAGQLEAAASSLYSTTQNVYNFQLKCVSANETWKDCASLAPGITSNSEALTAFGPAIANIGDPTATALANQFAKDSTATIAAPSAAQGGTMWANFLDTYVGLIKRCGQLVTDQ